MSTARDQKLVQLFEQALELPEREWDDFARRASAGDSDLATELIELLRYARQEDAFLEPPRILSKGGGKDGEAAAVSEIPPEKIGPYRILKVIAEGGMGTVYLAEQMAPIRRPVALKLIKLGMDTKQVLRRFNAERQTLALMDHPHIARVYDAGTTPEGRPYFVMEYFPGRSLNRFADEEQLTVPDRLRLFLQACSGVHSAHQKGVIHRDLKPSNLLVMRLEDRPFLKVIDFGIAKVVADDRPEFTRFTEQGEVIGTPEYMSPEQAGLEPGGIDTTSDVYSLGVVLYELLTGKLPFETRDHRTGVTRGGWKDETRPTPTRPSERLEREGSSDSAARDRRTTRSELRGLLRRDLDWVVLTALDWDRTRRYQSVHELSADIKRFLDGETVLAAAPTHLYMLRKFLHRYRKLAVSVAAVLLTLVLGIAATSWFAIQAHSARERQVEATHLAEANRDLAEQKAYVANMMAAGAALRDGDMASVAKYVDEAPESLRGWEWQYLDHRVDESRLLLKVPEGYELRMRPGALALTSEGSRVAAVVDGDHDGRYMEWDAASGDLLRQRSFTGLPGAACLSPDGRWLVRIEGDRCLVEDAATGEVHRTLFSPVCLKYHIPVQVTDGARWFYLDLDRNPEPGRAGLNDWVVDVEGGKFIELPGDSGWPTFLEERGQLVLAVGRRLEVRDLRTGDLVRTLRGTDNYFTDCNWDANRGWVITAGMSGTVTAWDPEVSDPAWIARPEEPKVLWSVDRSDRRVFAGGRDRDILVFDAATGAREGTLHGHRDEVLEICSNPAGTVVASRTTTAIRVWDVDDVLENRDVLGGHESFVYPVAFNRRGDRIASGGWDGRVIVRDPRDGHVVTQRRYADPRVCSIRALEFTPEGLLLGTVVREVENSLLIRMDPETGAVDSLVIPTRIYPRMALDPVRPRAAAIWFFYQSPKGLTVWDTDRMEPVHEERLDRPISLDHHMCLDYRPDGSELAVHLGDPELRLLDPETYATVRTVDLEGHYLTQIAYSPDGSMLAGAREDQVILIWDTSTWKPLGKLSGHRGLVYGLTWSPDGSRLISGGDDRLIRFWDPRHFDELVALRGHGSYVYSVAMSPDDSILASGSGDGTVRLWRR